MNKQDFTYEVNQRGMLEAVEARRLTPGRLAREARVDIRTIKRLLDPDASRRIVRAQTLRYLSEALGVDPTTLVYGFPNNPVSQDKYGRLIPMKAGERDVA